MKAFKIKKFFNENLKTIIAIITTVLLVGGTTAFASYNYFAKDVEYEKNDGTKISVENAINELYNRNNNSYSGEFKLFADTQADYGRSSYFDINTNGFNNLKIKVNALFSSNTSVFQSYILADGKKIYDIYKIEEIQLDVTNISNIRIFYYENEGYYYLQGSYYLY